MLKLILKNLWARRVRNAWLLAELILVTVLTWYITDPLFVLSYNQTLPLGYEPDGLLIAPIRSLPEFCWHDPSRFREIISFYYS